LLSVLLTVRELCACHGFVTADTLVCSGRACFVLLVLWLASDHVHYTVFERFFVLAEAVLLPGVVHDLSVEAVTRHAALKHTDAVFIVRLLLKLQGAAVLHELLELARMPSAKFFQGGFDLLLFDIRVFFVLRATW
jgi:hypothetical protein